MSDLNPRQLQFEHPAKRQYLHDILNLSSGTLGGMSNEIEFKQIEEVRSIWFDHTINSEIIFENWMESWRNFLEEFNIPFQKKCNKLVIEGKVLDIIEGI